jgi:hypothetical protein
MVGFRIVCAQWGDLYDDSVVESLRAQVASHCSVPYTFHVIREFDDVFGDAHAAHYRGVGVPLDPREVIHNGFHRDDFGGIPHHRKIELFRKDQEFADRGDRILYLDLDAKIHGDLAYFYHLDDSKPWIVKNYWWEADPSTHERQYHITRCPLFNSSVLRWVRGQNGPIYTFLNRNADKAFFTYPSMDTFMYHQFGPFTPSNRQNHFTHFDDGIVTTERASKTTGIVHMFEGMPHQEKLTRARSS